MSKSKARPAVLLDRDGVLVEDRDYAYRPEDMRVLPDVVRSLRRLHELGFALVVISNQSGVARGRFTLADAFRFNDAMTAALRAGGGPALDAIYVCPHHPDGSTPEFSRECHCRKPAPGLVIQAARDLNLDLRRSWFVGDKHSDIECANRAGVSGVQIMTKPGEVRHPLAKGAYGSLAEWVDTL